MNFSGYIKLNELRHLKDSDLIEMISDSKNYKDLKQKIQNKGISKEKYKDFLTEIKQDLDPIEKVRNCIAHNRSIPSDYCDNYEKAKEKLEDSIHSFWDKIKRSDNNK